jgi:hypothetical protein
MKKLINHTGVVLKQISHKLQVVYIVLKIQLTI